MLKFSQQFSQRKEKNINRVVKNRRYWPKLRETSTSFNAYLMKIHRYTSTTLPNKVCFATSQLILFTSPNDRIMLRLVVAIKIKFACITSRINSMAPALMKLLYWFESKKGFFFLFYLAVVSRIANNQTIGVKFYCIMYASPLQCVHFSPSLFISIVFL